LVWNHVIESDNANNPVGTQFGVYTAQGGMSSYLLLDKIGNIVARGQAMDITEGVTATQLSTLVK
ncbi:MAG: hypothetical protein JNL32_15695, partial [Candidatus Kapabacteria bacterium]|nr:hypothetical protein [Candidatus Kapabacteria bacterium]